MVARKFYSSTNATTSKKNMEPYNGVLWTLSASARLTARFTRPVILVSLGTKSEILHLRPVAAGRSRRHLGGAERIDCYLIEGNCYLHRFSRERCSATNLYWVCSLSIYENHLHLSRYQFSSQRYVCMYVRVIPSSRVSAAGLCSVFLWRQPAASNE